MGNFGKFLPFKMHQVWVGFISWPLLFNTGMSCWYFVNGLFHPYIKVAWFPSRKIRWNKPRNLMVANQLPARHPIVEPSGPMFLRGASEWGTTADQYKDWCGFWHGSLQVLYQGTGCFVFPGNVFLRFCSYYSWDEWYIFTNLHEWLICYGFHVGKYTNRPMDAMGFRGMDFSLLFFCSWNFGMGCFGWRERHGRDPNKMLFWLPANCFVLSFFGKDYYFCCLLFLFVVVVVVVVVVAAVRFKPSFSALFCCIVVRFRLWTQPFLGLDPKTFIGVSPLKAQPGFSLVGMDLMDSKQISLEVKKKRMEEWNPSTKSSRFFKRLKDFISQWFGHWWFGGSDWSISLMKGRKGFLGVQVHRIPNHQPLNHRSINHYYSYQGLGGGFNYF